MLRPRAATCRRSCAAAPQRLAGRVRRCRASAQPTSQQAQRRQQQQEEGVPDDQRQQQQQPQPQQQEGDAPEEQLAVSRVSSSSGSRRAFSQVFCRIAGIETTPLQDITPEQLAAAPFPAYTPLLADADIVVQQKRPNVWDLQHRGVTDTDAGYLAFFTAMHAVALVGAPLTFTWDAFHVMLAGYVVTGMLGISMSYHRQLSHKSFRCPKWLEYTLAYCGALAFEGDPIEWAKGHVWHHTHSDTPADRHSPRDGLWHSHMGWLFDESLTNTRRDASGNSKESMAAPWFVRESPHFYGWLRETYMWHMIGQGAAFAVVGGWPYFIWGFVVRVLFTMHMTWLVNSAVHVWGSRDYDTGDNSRNNALVALLVFGDGWHNNHHAHPSSAAHGLEWWQVDLSYYLISALEAVGLAWDVKRPSEAAKARLRLRPAGAAGGGGPAPPAA